MRGIKSKPSDTKRDLMALQHTPPQNVLKINNTLLWVVCLLMFVVFVVGFLVLPKNQILENYKVSQKLSTATHTNNNPELPILTDEINQLRQQFVGLVNGSIESKLRILEDNIRMGRINASLGTMQDLKKDITILQSYSPVATPKKTVKNQLNIKVSHEVSQLTDLIYLTLTSCGLIIATLGGVWLKDNYHINHHKSKATLEKRE